MREGWSVILDISRNLSPLTKAYDGWPPGLCAGPLVYSVLTNREKQPLPSLGSGLPAASLGVFTQVTPVRMCAALSV